MSRSIGHIKGVLSPEECQTILNSNHYGEEETLFGEYGELSVDIDVELLSKIAGAVDTWLGNLRIPNHYDLDCTKIAHIQSTIPTHADPVESHNDEGHIYTRHFVCVTYLTDFEMGEIMFPQHGKVIKPNQGDMVIFPTGPFYQHQVNVSIGERWILRTNFNYRY